MTFYKSSGSQTGCHEELNLADFEPINMLPRRRSLSGFGKKPAESGLVELYPYNPNSKRLNIKFETSEERNISSTSVDKERVQKYRVIACSYSVSYNFSNQSNFLDCTEYYYGYRHS
ncbi:hypothetical protein CDV36_006789 [Fusarium kuroshium]|uniref:Uncharacterized protein n=1 Tax=Fusarium kuroshium TaxID=2010991 RepID=A0A3M2S7M9_9HYPO|nr:hypothetical protein CDV36_006789 [Fusarium kuroshium]